MSSALTLPAGQGGIAGEQLPANDEAGSRRSREGRRLRVQGTGTDGPPRNFETNGTDGTIGNAETKHIQTEIQNETKIDNDRYIFSQLVSNVPFWNGWAFNVVVQKANVVRRKRKFCRVVRVLLMLTCWIEFTLDMRIFPCVGLE